MGKMIPIVWLLLWGLQLSAQSPAAVTSEQGRIVALENAWNEAVQQKDTVALDMLLGAELVYVDYDGKLMDKAQYVASVRSQAVHPARVVNEAMNVHVYGGFAVVNGVYREDGMKNEKPYVLRERFTDTWVQREKGWVCVASHSTLIGH
jgi:ketosteroid isomerase-like protein